MSHIIEYKLSHTPQTPFGDFKCSLYHTNQLKSKIKTFPISSRIKPRTKKLTQTGVLRWDKSKIFNFPGSRKKKKKEKEKRGWIGEAL